MLEEGLKAVRQWHEDVESSGLALDVLVYHVTEFDTAAQHTGPSWRPDIRTGPNFSPACLKSSRTATC